MEYNAWDIVSVNIRVMSSGRNQSLPVDQSTLQACLEGNHATVALAAGAISRQSGSWWHIFVFYL